MRALSALAALVIALGSLPACSTDPETAKAQYLASGDEYLADGQLNEAIIQYQNAIQQVSTSGEAYFKLGTALTQQGNLQAAYTNFVRAADYLPDDPIAQLRAGQVHLLAREFEDAQARAARALELAPSNVDAHILMGNALAGLQDMDAAIAQVEAAIAAEPGRGDAYASLGGLQFARGNRAEAEAAFQQGVEADPESVEARIALANFYLFDGQVERVEAVLRDALAISPNDVLANRGLYLLYRSQGRHAEAEAPLKAVVDATGAPEARLALADYYYSTGRRDESLALLDGMIPESGPSGAAASVRKASILAAEGRTAEATSILDGVLTDRPNNVGALVSRAQLYVDAGQLEDARRLAERARGASAQDPAGHFALGRVLKGLGETEAAIAAFNDVLRLAPGHLPAQQDLAQLYLAAGRASDARAMADNVLRVLPDDVDATMVRARALTREGRAASAESSAVALANRLPDSAQARALLGTVYAAQGKLTPAGQAWQTTLRLDPANLEAIRGLMSIDVSRSNPAAAAARADRLVEEQPDAPAALLLAAEAYMAANSSEKAEQTLRRVVQIAPDQMQAYAMLGQIYAAQDRLDDAIAEFTRITELDPRSVSAHTVVGMLLEAKGDRAAAQQRYERIITIDRTAPVAANNLAWIYAETGGNLDVALGLAQTAKAGLPDSAQVSDTLGWIYHKRGMSALALPQLRHAIEQEPNDPLFHYHIGVVYAAAGDNARAKTSLERALALDPAFEGADDARRVLRDLQG